MNCDKFYKEYLNILNEQVENEEEKETEVEVDKAETEAETADEETSKSCLDALIEEYKNKEEITKDDIIALLNVAVCDEMLASFNYRISYNISKTDGKADFDPEFEAHEDEEDDHADKIIKRLREMNADVLMIPWDEYLAKNSCGTDWAQETSNDSKVILLNRYNEELNAVKFYDLILSCIEKMKATGDWDTSTERMIKEIKKDEEEHALDLHDLLVQYDVDVEVKDMNDVEPETDEAEEEFEDEDEDK